MSNLTVDVELAGRDPISIVMPANEVVSTTLVVSGTNPSLPTLASVERINGRLSDLGIVLGNPGQVDQLASVVNAHYLAVPPANWVDMNVRVSGQLLTGNDDRTALRAVRTVRAPTLHAAQRVLGVGSTGNPLDRRAVETRLVDSLSQSIRQDRKIWQTRAAKVALYLGKTALDVIITGLVGVPLVDIARHAIVGLGRIE